MIRGRRLDASHIISYFSPCSYPRILSISARGLVRGGDQTLASSKRNVVKGVSFLLLPFIVYLEFLNLSADTSYKERRIEGERVPKSPLHTRVATVQTHLPSCPVILRQTSPAYHRIKYQDTTASSVEPRLLSLSEFFSLPCQRSTH